MSFPAFSRLALETIGRGHGDHVHEERLIGGLVKLDVADRQRTKRFAVIAVAQGDETALGAAAQIAPVVKAHLDGNFHCRRAVVGIEAALETVGRESCESLRQLYGRRMGKTREQGVLELLQLCCEAPVDEWI